MSSGDLDLVLDSLDDPSDPNLKWDDILGCLGSAESYPILLPFEILLCAILQLITRMLFRSFLNSLSLSDPSAKTFPVPPSRIV